jgi:gliding motility-associated-like protein
MRIILSLIVSLGLVGIAYARHEKPLYPFVMADSDSTDVFRQALLRQFMGNCEHNIVLMNVESNTNYFYWAANSIRVSHNYRINGNSGADITMKAGKVIVLKPKTVVLRGSKYLARIEPCELTCPTAEGFVAPRGISPNGDGYNDSFDLSGLCVTNLKIFNRYGIHIYEAQDYEDEWDGRSDKGDLPSGTYFYVITLLGGVHITGWVYLEKE